MLFPTVLLCICLILYTACNTITTTTTTTITTSSTTNIKTQVRHPVAYKLDYVVLYYLVSDVYSLTELVWVCSSYAACSVMCR
jgi:hypothetical protein